MNQPTDNDAFENDAADQTLQNDRSAHPAAADGENQHRLNEVPNQLSYKQKQPIKVRLAIITVVLMFCSILITLAQNFGVFDRFRDPGADINERVKKADRHVGAIKKKHDEVEKIVKGIREMTAEIAAAAPNKAKQSAREIGDNPEASQLEKSIARALSLQLDNKTDLAIGEWKNIAERAARSDNEQAENAWFSVGYLSPDPEDRILAYDQAIRLKPDHAVAYNNRGNAKNDLQQYKAAIADYDEAIYLKADYAEAYYNRGYTKNDLQQYKAAIADYDEAIRLKPDLAEAYINRGNAKNNLQQYKAAIADYDEAIRLKADYAEAYYNRGHTKNTLQQYKAAIADYDEAIRLKADDALAYNNRGNTKNNLQQYKAAIADYDEAIRLKPGNAAAYYNRGNAKDNLQQYKAAIADYDEAIRLKPDLAEAYNNRGFAKKALGLKDEARKDFETALEHARNAQ